MKSLFLYASSVALPSLSLIVSLEPSAVRFVTRVTRGGGSSRKSCLLVPRRLQHLLYRALKMAAVKLGPHLKELRILLCQTSKSSKGVREFIEQQYVPLKKSNPQFPVLIRECSQVDPCLYARYEFGVERCIPLQNLKSEEVLKRIQDIATSKPN